MIPSFFMPDSSLDRALRSMFRYSAMAFLSRNGKGKAVFQTGKILQIGQNLITGSWAEQAVQPLMKHQPFFCHNPHEVFEKLSVAGAVSGTIVYKPVIGDEQDRAALFHGYG